MAGARVIPRGHSVPMWRTPSRGHQGSQVLGALAGGLAGRSPRRFFLKGAGKNLRELKS